MMYINIIIIAVIFVCITDLTDFPDTIKTLISRILTKNKLNTSNFRVHLLDCSLCQTFWASLIYLIITHNLSLLAIGFVLLVAVNTQLIKDAIITVNKILTDIFKIISENL